MLFNTRDFALFLPLVFALYWLLNKKDLRIQNILLLVASYFFYACWDYRFLFLLIFSTSLDYYTGLRIQQAASHKSKLRWLLLSIIVNLGFLGVFKYYNFFATSFAQGIALLGFKADFVTLNVILPVGISFYTFHGLSYIFDIFRGKIKAVKSIIDYSVFVSFFPLLVAGPIERATHLLPQIRKKRTFDYSKAVDGLRQILWGLFKKCVIADNCADFANQIFNNSDSYSGFMLLLGAVFFAFQIYGDFSGYSDIALGTSRLLGIELLRNFAYPYFSRDIAEFWRRWHISLSSWFRDYVYIPLGGSKGDTWLKIRNIFIIFLLSGFWHGANWTFIAWGALNAIFFLPLLLLKKNRTNIETVAAGKYLPSFREFFSMLITFAITTIAWIYFRAEDMAHANCYIYSMTTGIFEDPCSVVYAGFWESYKLIIVMIIIFMTVEWIGREQQHALVNVGKIKYRLIRWTIYSLLIFIIALYMKTEETPFIYFQF